LACCSLLGRGGGTGSPVVRSAVFSASIGLLGSATIDVSRPLSRPIDALGRETALLALERVRLAAA